MTKRNEPDDAVENESLKTKRERAADERERAADAEHERIALNQTPPCPPGTTPPPAPVPQEGDLTRVLLTSDDRNVLTEEWIPTAEFGFRINVRGQFFEHVSENDSGATWVFAPTR